MSRLPLYTSVNAVRPHDRDVAPDGKRFLINTISAEGTAVPITIVVNWAAGLIEEVISTINSADLVFMRYVTIILLNERETIGDA
jgi:hypothetical protein